MSTYKEIVTKWANDNYDSDVYGWDFFLVDALVDGIYFDAIEDIDELIDDVKDRLSEMRDDPENHGVAVTPVYSYTIEAIYQAQPSDVEDHALEAYGSLSELSEGCSSISEIIQTAVWMYLNGKARQSACDLIDVLDELEDMLYEAFPESEEA